ncbi:hypothetical protein ROLI_014790 [Roseobacter fucihabitans]|uniref:Uncharacterized protein n=1 Tax=Roseobacter fucihabitans TaxID=1537242 RepID=A0ABZ2BU49_9RHOB
MSATWCTPTELKASGHCSSAGTSAFTTKKELSRIDKRIDALLGRIVNAQSDAIVPVYEGEIVALERGKAILAEQMQKQAEPKGSFEEKLEPAIMFLASPWKIWETPGSAQVNLRRLVLKLALKTRIKYCRNDGARTPEISFPFIALRAVSDPKVCFGADGGTRTRTIIRSRDFLTRYDFRRRRNTPFVVWTIPSPSPVPRS